jgi:4-carboxymuconolactone decarboxylase
MSDAQRAVAAEIAAGPRAGVRGPFIALLHNPELARRLQSLGEYLRFQTGLPDPLVELAILVTARHFTCQYEWYAHERLARKAGLDGATIEAIAEGRTPEGMTADESVVHAFATEALTRGQPGDQAFEAARARFGLEKVLSLLAICGYYSTLALVLNTAQPPLPEGTPPPLSPPPASGGELP